MNHQLILGVNHCIETLPDTMQNIVQSGDIAGAEKLYQELLNLIQSGEGNFHTAVAENSLENVISDFTLLQTADDQLLLLPSDGQAQVFTFPGDAQLLQTFLQPENSAFLQKLIN